MRKTKLLAVISLFCIIATFMGRRSDIARAAGGYDLSVSHCISFETDCSAGTAWLDINPDPNFGAGGVADNSASLDTCWNDANNNCLNVTPQITYDCTGTSDPMTVCYANAHITDSQYCIEVTDPHGADDGIVQCGQQEFNSCFQGFFSCAPSGIGQNAVPSTCYVIECSGTGGD